MQSKSAVVGFVSAKPAMVSIWHETPLNFNVSGRPRGDSFGSAVRAELHEQ
jgi:hypothetical protein